MKPLNKKILILVLMLFFSFSQIFAQWDKITTIPPQYSNTKGWLEFWFLEDEPNYGWVCGFGGQVIRTTDGGETWEGTVIRGAAQLESITFVDKYIGFVSGISTGGFGEIYKSVDGGRTWRKITPFSRANQLWGNYFLDKDNGVVIGGGCGNSGLQFFRTNDGGNTWRLYRYPSTNSGLSDVVLYPNGKGYASSSGRIWQTLDGGYTWIKIISTGAADWQEDLHISGKTILVPYSKGCTGGLNSGGIRISTNFGKSWRDINTHNAMFGAWLNDNLHGWACGHEASLYHTTNGGITWNMENCGIVEDEVLDDFWFFNDTTGFVCGKYIYRYKIPRNIYTRILHTELTACDGDTIILAADGKYFHYDWSNGAKDSLIKVTKSGKYILTAYNSICDTAHPDTVTVHFSPSPDINLQIVPDTVICAGDSVILIVNTNADKIQWSTGEKTDTIIVKKEGKYKVTVWNESGCDKVKEVNIKVIPLPEPKLTLQGRNIFCRGDSTTIIATPGYSHYIWYDGNGNKTITKSNKIKVGSSGIYYCFATNEFGCLGGGKDSIKITVINEVNRLTFSFPENNEFSLDSTYFPNMICKNMRIKNITKKEWKINLPYLFHNISFSFPQSQFPLTIQGGESVDIKICYSPTQLGEERDTVVFDDLCNPHLLKLKGLSLVSTYNSSSVCNTQVVGHTVRLSDKYRFSTTEPYPNPAGVSVIVPFNRFSTNNTNGKEKAAIYNIYGNEVCNAERKIIAMSKVDNSILTIGKFVFDTKDIRAGSYIIIIRTESEIIKHNLLILH